mmetsp:Transcript_26008/g.61377  ORF Transcript_26008/g.61377 Transcript_26008/m.61377 type:complete len:315 (-) Transcript_26008:58-1002(-)
MAIFAVAYALEKMDERNNPADPGGSHKDEGHLHARRLAEAAGPPMNAAAHRSEEGYKQRYLPGQGWVEVVPEHSLRFTLRAGSPSGTVEATMCKDDSHFVDVTFAPGSLGLGADWDSGKVTTVVPGQAKQQGVLVGWVYYKIDGRRYSESLLNERIAGSCAYTVTFAINLALLAQSLLDESFKLRIGASDTTEVVEEQIWRVRRIRDASVAVQLLSSGGDQLMPDALVLESLPTFSYTLTLSVVRWSSDFEVVLEASTLGGESFQISVEAQAHVEMVAAKIHKDRGLQCDVSVSLIGLGGSVLPTGEPVMKFLS